jgi:hypothetical protein
MFRIIEIRPYRNGWQCFEGPGVGPYWIGDNAKEQALGYGTERGKSDGSEIHVLDRQGTVAETFSFLKRNTETARLPVEVFRTLARAMRSLSV